MNILERSISKHYLPWHESSSVSLDINEGNNQGKDSS